MRIGGQKGKRTFRIALVLCQVKGHPADEVPEGIARLEPARSAPRTDTDFCKNQRVERLPEALQGANAQVFRALHGRSGFRQRGELLLRRGREGFRRRDILSVAKLREVAPAQIAPIGPRRRQRGIELFGRQMQEQVRRPLRGSLPQDLRAPGIKRLRAVFVKVKRPLRGQSKRH